MMALIKVIRPVIVLHVLLLALIPISLDVFINIEVAFFSAFFILLGSMYSYASLVRRKIEHYEAASEPDMIDKIDDPYDLYEDEAKDHTSTVETEDLKTVIKEEKQRIKARGTAKSVKQSAPAIMSFYRLVPYGILVLGFMGLKNSEVLAVWPYLTGLGLGILGGLFTGRVFFTR